MEEMTTGLECLDKLNDWLDYMDMKAGQDAMMQLHGMDREMTEEDWSELEEVI